MSLRLCVAIECRHKQSIGTQIRCAVALGASLVLLIGASKFGTHGSHGAQTRVEIMHFFYWEEALQYLRQQSSSGQPSRQPGGQPEKVFLYGIASNNATSGAVMSTAVTAYSFAPISDYPGHRTTTVFVVGNKETGLSRGVLPLLDAVFHIDVPNPQYYERLHSDAILSICLHHYLLSSKASLESRRIDEAQMEKFELDAPMANWRANMRKKKCDGNVPFLDERGTAFEEEEGEGILLGLFSTPS